MATAQPTHDVVVGLCKRFGDESRVKVLQSIAMPQSNPSPPSSAQPDKLTAPAAPPNPAHAVLSATPSTGPVSEPTFSEAELSTLQEPKPFSEWGGVHERALAYMRWRRDAEVKKDAGLKPSAEMASDLRLWRFLGATKFKAAEAAEMYIDALRWRKQMGQDARRDRVVAANPGFFGGGSLVLQKPLLNEAAVAMADARPRTFYRKVEGGFEVLLDKSGNLVYIEVLASVDAASVSAQGDAYMNAEMEAQELLQLIVDELSRRAGRLILIFRVMDFAGYSVMPNPFRSSAIKEGEAMVKAAGKEVKDTFPTTTFKNFLINAPAASTMGPIISAMIPARTKKKTVIKGDQFMSELHEFVEPSMLPQKLGGKLSDGAQWEKPKKGKK